MIYYSFRYLAGHIFRLDRQIYQVDDKTEELPKQTKIIL